MTRILDLAKYPAKMVYVGFSRPTHLLAFTVHKDRFVSYLNDLDSDLWDVLRLYEEREPS